MPPQMHKRMTMAIRAGWRLTLIALLALPVALLARQPATEPASEPSTQPAPAPVSPMAVLNECTKAQADAKELQMVIWFPLEAMTELSAERPAANPELRQRTLVMLQPYVVVAAVRIHNNGGQPEFMSPDDLRKSTTLITGNGTEIKPEMQPPTPSIAAFAAAMKGGVNQTNDLVHQHMEILMFHAPQGDQPLINEMTRDKLTLRLDATPTLKPFEATWHTPLDAMVPMHRCPTCHELISARFAYCPYCGAKQAELLVPMTTTEPATQPTTQSAAP